MADAIQSGLATGGLTEEQLRILGDDFGPDPSFVNTPDPKVEAQEQRKEEPKEVPLPDGHTREKKKKEDDGDGFIVETARTLNTGAKNFLSELGETVDQFSLFNKDSIIRKALPIKAEWLDVDASESVDSVGNAITDAPESIGGKIGTELIQFGLGWATGRQLLGNLNPNIDIKKAKNTGQAFFDLAKQGGFETLASGFGTFLASDPHAQRLSDFLQTFPSLSNPVTDFLFTSLESDKNDSVLEGKFKASLEDVLTAGAIEIVYNGVRLVKHGMRIRAHGGEEAYAKFLEKNKDAMDAHVKMFVDEQQGTAKTFGGHEGKTGIGKSGVAEGPPRKLQGETKEGRALQEVSDKITKSDEAFTITPDQINVFVKSINQIQKDGTFDGEGLMEGVFNFDRMESGASVEKTLKAFVQVLSEHKGFTKKRSFEETEQLADILGENSSSLIGALKVAKASVENLDAHMVAGKKMMQSVSRELYQVAIKAERGDEQSKVNMLRLIEVQRELVDSIKGIRTASARTTSAGRIKTGDQLSPDEIRAIINNSGGDEKLTKLATALRMSEGNPKAIKEISTLAKAVNIHNEYWISSILSGVKTHVVNISAGTINTFLLPAQKALGAILRGDTSSAKEAIATYKFLGRFFSDSLEMARRAFDVEDALLDSTSRTLDGNVVKAISAGKLPKFSDMMAMSSKGDILGWFGKAGVNFLGHMIRLPNRFLMAEDEFFKQMAYRSNIASKASLEGTSIGLSSTKKVRVMEGGKERFISELDAHIDKKMKEAFSTQKFEKGEVIGRGTGRLTRNAERRLVTGESIGEDGLMNLQTAGTNKGARQQAREVTFTEQLSDIDTYFGNMGAGLQRMINSAPILRGLFMPFVRVPTNLMRRAVDNSPMALATKRFSDILQSGSEEEKALAIGKLASGTVLWGYATTLVMDGRVTGASPRDKELREAKLATGWRPYSFVLGSVHTDAQGNITEDNRRWVSFQRLDPFGVPFGIIADYVAVQNKVSQEDGDNLAVAMGVSMANNLSSKSYLKGLMDIFRTFNDEDGEMMQRFLNSRASSYIPNAFGLADFNGDDEMKHVRTMMDSLVNKIPGMSDRLEAKRDIFGEKKLTPDGFPSDTINPFTVSEATNDPVKTELNRLAESPSQAQFSGIGEKLTNNIDLTKFRNENNQTAFDRYQELMKTTVKGGMTLHEKLGDLISSEKYSQGDPSGLDGTALHKQGKRSRLIKENLQKYRDKALKTLMREFPEIKDLHKKDTKDDRRVKRGRKARFDNLLKN